jgi:hypothetical protein
MKSEQVKNDKGVFYIFHLQPKSVRKATPEEIKLGQNWKAIVGSNDLRIDDDETAKIQDNSIEAKAKAADEGEF